MVKLTQTEINKALELHQLWLKCDPSGVIADFSGKDLTGANLSYANLSYAKLSGANLYGANLSGAILSGANLYGANLSDANLSYANLSGANLSRAILSDAKFFNTIGNNRQVKSLQIGTYLVTYTKEVMQIGCKRYPIEDWFTFDDQQIQALAWWIKAKPLLRMAIDLFPAE